MSELYDVIRDYIVVKDGVQCSDTDGLTSLPREYRGFAATSVYDPNLYWFEMYRDGLLEKRMYSVERSYALVLPVHIRFAREQFEGSIVKRIEAQKHQNVILNPPRDQFGPSIPWIGQEDYNDFMHLFPNLCWGLQWGPGLGGSETGVCLRDYARGYQFSCEAVSYCGGTPLDAIVRSLQSVAGLINGRQELGNEIAYAAFSTTTGMLDLSFIDRWMGFMKQEYELRRK